MTKTKLITIKCPTHTLIHKVIPSKSDSPSRGIPMMGRTRLNILTITNNKLYSLTRELANLTLNPASRR